MAALAIAVVILAVRLVVAPLDLDFLTPQVTAWLDARADPYTVTIGKTRLRWQAGKSTIGVEAVDAELHAPHREGAAPAEGTPVLKADFLQFSLSLRPLLHKRFQPTRMTLRGAHLDLVHRPDGAFALAGIPIYDPDSAAQPGEATRSMTMRVVGELSGSGSTNGAKRTQTLARLDAVAIDGATINVDDQAFGTQWSLAKANLAFQRTGTGWTLHVDADGGAGTARSQLAAALSYSANSQQLTYVGTIDALNPSEWVANIRRPPSELVPLTALNMPLQAHLEGVADLGAWSLGPMKLFLSGGAGSVADPRLAGGVLPLSGFNLGASYDPPGRSAVLDHARIDLGGPSIELSGHASKLPIIFRENLTQAVPMVFDVTMRDMPESRFETTWPPGLAPNARHWFLEHLSKGAISELKTHIEAAWQPQTPAVVADSVTGSMQLKGFTIDYLPGLTPARNVDAAVTFNRQRFDFAFESGQLRDLRIGAGKATIDGLEQPVQTLSIDLPMTGPAGDIVKLLAMDRLKIAQRAGLSPDGIAGQVDGTVHFDFPLLNDLPLEKLNYNATAELTGAEIPKVVLGRDLSEGTLKVALTTKLLSAEGDAKLDGNPARFTWSQRVSGSSPDRMRAKVAITLDSAARARFGLDVLPDYVSGPVGIEADYVAKDGGVSEADTSLDLSKAALTASDLYWSKAPGPAAHASLSVMMRDNRVSTIEGLRIEAPGLSMQGDAGFIGQGVFSVAHIARLEMNGSQVHGQAGRSDRGWDIQLAGPLIDLTPYLKGLKNNNTPDADKRAPLHLALKADTMIVGDNRSMDHAGLDALLLRGSLDTLQLSGGIGQGKHATVKIDSPGGDGALSINADDLGAFLQVTGIARNIRGGSLKITGENHRTDGVRSFTAHLDGRDYRLLNAPVIARLLTVSSPTSIVSLMSGNGIPFDVLVGDLTLRNGVVTVTDARANGSALGLTAAGKIDLKGNTIDLSGTVVPAYLLNGSLGKLPVLGNLLTGGAGNGIFAANYNLGGSLDHIDVSVNPLSVLAPGFLRDFFIFSAGHPDAKPPPPANAAKVPPPG